MTQIETMKIKNRNQSSRCRLRLHRSGKKETPEALFVYGELYLHAETVRNKLEKITPDMLEEYEKIYRERMQNRLDNGEEVDIRASEMILKRNLYDFRQILNALNKFIKTANEQTIKAFKNGEYDHGSEADAQD